MSYTSVRRNSPCLSVSVSASPVSRNSSSFLPKENDDVKLVVDKMRGECTVSVLRGIRDCSSRWEKMLPSSRYLSSPLLESMVSFRTWWRLGIQGGLGDSGALGDQGVLRLRAGLH